MTTLELGGNAEYLASVSSMGTLEEALEFAVQLGLRVTILGGQQRYRSASRGIGPGPPARLE